MINLFIKFTNNYILNNTINNQLTKIFRFTFPSKQQFESRIPEKLRKKAYIKILKPPKLEPEQKAKKAYSIRSQRGAKKGSFFKLKNDDQKDYLTVFKLDKIKFGKILSESTLYLNALYFLLTILAINRLMNLFTTARTVISYPPNAQKTLHLLELHIL